MHKSLHAGSFIFRMRHYNQSRIILYLILIHIYYYVRFKNDEELLIRNNITIIPSHIFLKIRFLYKCKEYKT